MKTLRIIVSVAVGDTPEGFRMEPLEIELDELSLPTRAHIHNLCHTAVSELLDDAINYSTATVKPRSKVVVQ